MKVFSQLEKAQLENTTSDTASHPKGMITYRTDLNQAKISNGTTYKLLIDEDSTQTLSNKTLSSPTISSPVITSGTITSSVITTGAVIHEQVATPANPASGYNKLYFKSDGKLYTLDSSGNEAAVGSGTGGVKNLITNGNADDTSSSIFVPYADAASTRPVDGTGGSPTVTTSMTTSTPLDGVKSFLLTKPASNVQGQGWSVPFTVDPAYRAKSLKISVDYIVSSGTFVAGGSGVESDVIWYIYDVTNSQLIEPSNIKMFSNNSSISDKFEATFQSSSSGSSYRLIAHVQSTSVSAFVLKVDNITVSPQAYVFGTPFTDEVDGGAITIGATTTAPTKGTTTIDKVRYHREGQFLVATYRYSQTSAGTAGSGDYLLTIPGGYQVDTSQVPVYTGAINAADSQRSIIGFGAGYDSGPSHQDFWPILYSATQFRIRQDALYSAVAFKSSTNGQLTLATLNFTITIKVPIQGGSSSVQMSSETDTRVVAAKLYRGASAQSIANNSTTKVQLNTVLFDTHGAADVTTNNRYIVQVPGKYRVVGSAQFSPNSAGIRAITLRKNGSDMSSAQSPNAGAGSSVAFSTSDLVDAVAGDYFELYVIQDSGSSLTLAAYSALTYMTVERLSGPSQIAASETVIARYSSSAGNSVPASRAIINFATKIQDTHGAVTTGASWKFTAPIAGTYSVQATTTPTIPNGNGYSIGIYVNGNLNKDMTFWNSGTTTDFTELVTTDVYLSAGDTINARHVTSVGSSLNTNAEMNEIVIKRVGY